MSANRRTCAGVTFALLLAAALAAAIPAFSFLPELTRDGSSGTPQADHWSMTSFAVQWNINPSPGSNISGTRSVSDAIAASFNSWTGAPNTSLTVTRGADAGYTRQSDAPSDVNLICFVCTDGQFGGGTETLAVTSTTTIDGAGGDDGHGGTTQFAGQILKADIVFNPGVKFDSGGGDGSQDLQTVATHEIGHFLGLDHSGVARTIMFPFAPAVLSTLSYDDVAGISSLYPSASPAVAAGSISGTVTLAGGSGVFGAHVYAVSTTSATPYGDATVIRKSPIGTLTRTDGSYTITGVPADSYTVIAEPLDDPVTDGDVSGYSTAYGQSQVQTNFTTRWH